MARNVPVVQLARAGVERDGPAVVIEPGIAGRDIEPPDAHGMRHDLGLGPLEGGNRPRRALGQFAGLAQVNRHNPGMWSRPGSPTTACRSR